MSQSGRRIISRQERARCRNLVAEKISKCVNQPLESLTMLMFIANTLFEAVSSSRAGYTFVTIGKVAGGRMVAGRSIYRLTKAQPSTVLNDGGSWLLSNEEIDECVKAQSFN